MVRSSSVQPPGVDPRLRGRVPRPVRWAVALALVALQMPAVAGAFEYPSLRRNCPEARERFASWLTEEGRGRPERAERDGELLARLASLCPGDESIERARGDLVARSQRLRSRNEAALEVDVAAELERALTMHREGDFAGARSMLEELRTNHGARHPEILFHLAGAVYGDGDRAQAVAYLEELLERAEALAPGEVEMARSYLARARRGARMEPSVEEPGFDRVDGRRFTFAWDGEGEATGSRGTQLQIEGFLDQAYFEVGGDLDRSYPGRAIPVIFYSPATFRSRYPAFGNFAGFWDGRAIRINANEVNTAGMKELLYHEYTHVLIEDLAKGRVVPVWLNEGLAEVEERRATQGRSRALEPTRTELRNLAVETKRGLHRPLRSFETRGFGANHGAAALRRSYSRAYIATTFLTDSVGSSGVIRILRGIGKGERYEEAFRSVYPGGPDQFEKDFERFALGRD